MGMERERLDARNAALAVGALLVASVMVLAFRWALFTSDVWAWVYVAMDLLAIALVALVFLRLSRAPEEAGEPSHRRERETARRPATATRTGPYPAVRGVYTIAGLGVFGALVEFGGQLFS
jgi:sugar phosphate permease